MSAGGSIQENLDVFFFSPKLLKIYVAPNAAANQAGEKAREPSRPDVTEKVVGFVRRLKPMLGPKRLEPLLAEHFAPQTFAKPSEEQKNKRSESSPEGQANQAVSWLSGLKNAAAESSL